MHSVFLLNAKSSSGMLRKGRERRKEEEESVKRDYEFVLWMLHV